MSESTEDPWAPLREAIRAQCDEQEDAPAEKSGDGWAGVIGGACPLQGHGHVDAHFWYFRARHDSWSFEVYPTSTEEELPPDEELTWDRYGSYAGDAHNAGWMKFSEAWPLIESHIALFRKELPRLQSECKSPEES